MASRLAGGQFYGQIASRREARSVVLSEIVHQAPRALPRHAHERSYLCLLLGGSYGEEVGRKPVQHRRLSLSSRPGGVEHRDWIGRGGGRFFMAELGVEWGCDSRDPALLNETEALGAMLGLYREFRNWDLCSPGVVEDLTAAVTECVAASPVERDRPSWVLRVAEWVHDRRGASMPLAELAREAGVHPAHLSRTFRRHYGRSPAELARQLRVRRADQAHMTRSITRWVGMSPGQLRKLLSHH